MDAHFREYLAVVAAMQELYGEPGDDRPTDFHDEAGWTEAGTCAADAVVAT